MSSLSRLRQFWQGLWTPPANRALRRARAASRGRFEKLERREMLSADPIHLGAVYYEDAFTSGADFSSPGDLLEISFTGGADNTQLTSLTIELDPQGGGLEVNDRIFDTILGGLGASGAVPLSIVSQNGIDSVQFELTGSELDGKTTLTIHFQGFEAGDRLVLGVDVDEFDQGGLSPTTEGSEFEGSTITGHFSAPTFQDANATGTFYNAFDFAGTNLNLPPDNYIPPGSVPAPDYTAGALANLQQVSLPITLSGQVFNDSNENNSLDSGESGIAGVSLELQIFNGNSYVSTGQNATTDATGHYHFDGLQPGEYRVVETQPTGYFSVGSSPGHVNGVTNGSVLSPDVLTDITLVGGQDSVENDFAESAAASLSGHVYHDADNDGVFDANETGLGGETLELRNDQGQVVATTVTDDQGFYEFSGLHFGTYSVHEVQPQGLFDGLDTAGSLGGVAQNPGDSITSITLHSGDHGLNYNFGELLPGSISGHVHADLDGDCVFDPNESGIAGVQIDLLDAQGLVLQSTTTDANGNYSFEGLAPGTYGIHEHQPDGYLDSGDHPGTAGGSVNPQINDRIDNIVLVSGTQAEQYNFCEVPPGSLSGHVYVDHDQDGIRDAGESPIPGTVIELRDENGALVSTTQTDVNGFYSFGELPPGTYTLHEIQPSGYFDGLDTPGTAGGTADNPGDTIRTIVLTAGAEASDYNFGEVAPASISGQVHADLDGDCVLDPDESPLAGVQIQLLNSQGQVIQTTTTDSDGRYEFDNLAPGTYGIHEVQPDGYFSSGTHPGTAGGQKAGDTISEIVLTSGLDAEEYNYCEQPYSSISGYVFQDGNTILVAPGTEQSLSNSRDGLHTGDDKPIAGVTLYLQDESGSLVLDANLNPVTAVTNAQGFYKFDALHAGTYTVVEAQPNGYVDNTDHAGTTGGQAVNPGDQINGIAVGVGQHSLNNNFSEIKATPEIPFNPPGNPPTPPPLVTENNFFFAGGAPPAAIGILPISPGRTPDLGPGATVGVAGDGYTWHLSIIDGGSPRGDLADGGAVMRIVPASFSGSLWVAADLDQSLWTLPKSGTPSLTDARQLVFGMRDGVPITGDFDGDGVTDLGVYLDGEWFIDLNGNGLWDEGDLWAQLGNPGDQPVTGDWNGDGKTDIGVFGRPWEGDDRALAHERGLPGAESTITEEPKNLPPGADQAPFARRTMRYTAEGNLRTDLIDHVFDYGEPGDRAVAGDWDGDGNDSIGVFRNGQWLLDVDGNGRWSDQIDRRVTFGSPSGIPVVGDFNGDGIDELGIYEDGHWTIDSNSDGIINALDQVFMLGGPQDLPVVGDWDGDGREEPGLYRHNGAPPHIN